eukprot:gene12337-25955_t
MRRVLSLGLKKRFPSSVASRTCSSDSVSYTPLVSYSGGQATVGQGGFYGSGGARKAGDNTPHSIHPKAVARIADVESLATIMDEVQALGGVVNAKTIDLKSKIRKTISNPQVRELLNKLEIKGEPVWGLSSEERELVKSARTKYAAS